MRNFMIVMILLLLWAMGNCDDNAGDFTDNNGIYLVGIGIGTLFQGSINVGFNQNYLCFRHNAFALPVLEGYFHETALMYGRTIMLNTSLKRYLSLSAGINNTFFNMRLKEGSDQLEKAQAFGLTIEGSIVLGTKKTSGFGCNTSINFNDTKILAGAFLSYYVGNFENKDYKPEIKKQELKRIYEKEKDAPFKREKKFGISQDYNVLYAFSEKGLKSNFVVQTKKFDLVFPTQFKQEDPKVNKILDNYSRLIRVGLKVRKFSEKGYYYDLGMERMELEHTTPSILDQDYTDSSYNLLVGFGNITYFSEWLYIRNQVNFAFPVAGDDITIPHSGINTDFMIADIELLVIGVSFGG